VDDSDVATGAGSQRFLLRHNGITDTVMPLGGAAVDANGLASPLAGHLRRTNAAGRVTRTSTDQRSRPCHENEYGPADEREPLLAQPH
jgi:hypothetical protein